MIGDNEIDQSTLWYDNVLNKIIEDNERTELAASFQEGTETPPKTSSTAPSESEA